MSRAATLPLEETQHICRYWLHRISHEWDVSYKLLSAGYLSIGWSALAGSGIERVFDLQPIANRLRHLCANMGIR